MVYGLGRWSLLCISMPQLPILSSPPREHDAIAYHCISRVRHLSWTLLDRRCRSGRLSKLNPSTNISFCLCGRQHAADTISNPKVLN